MTSRSLGADQLHLDLPPLHLSGHLTPAAGGAEGGVDTVSTNAALGGGGTETCQLKVKERQ